MVHVTIGTLMVPSVAFFQQNGECSERISNISNDIIATETAKVMLQVYRELGCLLEIINLPGRRSFSAFKTGEVDGELYRFPIGTKNYTRPFVQSDLPLFEISNSLWAAPGSKRYAERPIGYMIGVAWQEAYLATNNLLKSGHFDIGDLILHYNDGNLDRFLAEDFSIKSAIRAGTFEEGRTPVQLEVLKVGVVYHFLGDKFTPFMQRLSDYLKDHQPFVDVGHI